MKTIRTGMQQAIAEKLASEFDIDAERILFLNSDKPEEPWLSAEALITIARRTEEFQAIDEGFNQFIAPLSQVVHAATVIDGKGHSFTRSGVATIGESEEIEAHPLAAGRAVSAALTAAGFHPLRPGTVVAINSRQPGTAQSADEASSRNTDLKRIHAIAENKGLIVPKAGGGWDRTGYRNLLVEKYGVNTAAGFGPTQRASLINHLEQLKDIEQSEITPHVIDEFADVA